MDDLYVSFHLFSEKEILALSVVRITSASTFDRALPKIGGLMDSRMGSTDRSILCQTCNTICVGHYGHIELPCRILLTGHIKKILALLRCVCHYCCQPLCTDGGDLKSISENAYKISSCPSCSSPVPEVNEHMKLFITKTFSKDQLEKMEKEEREFNLQRFTPDDMWSIIDKIPTDFLIKLGMKESHPRDALPRVLLVLPPAQRPSLRIADGGKTKGEDDLTLLYQDIIRAALEYEQVYGSPYFTPLEIKEKKKRVPCDLFGKLQLFCSCLIKNSYRSDKKINIKGVIDHVASRGTFL